MLAKVLTVVLLLLLAVGIAGQVRKAMRERPAAVATPDSLRDLTLDPSTRRSGAAGSLTAPLPPLDSITRIDIRDQVRAELDRHYLDSLLSGTDSIVRHWPRELEPVPFAIIPGGPATFTSAMAFEARAAVDAWGSAGAGLRLVETSDTSAALLTLRWVDTLGGERGGYTDVTWDRSGRIRKAQIYLATRATVSGRDLSPQARKEIALHEIGHALGLPHSPNPNDVMYPVAQNSFPSDRDRFSLRMLYQLPTGWIGVGERVANATTLGTPALLQAFFRVDSIIESGIRRGVYPGAALVIGRASGPLYQRGYGRFEWRKGQPVSPDSTRWDLASLTKVVGTTAAVLRLVDQKKVKLDDPVARYLPRFSGPGKESVTVRMLLNHTSGLRAYLPLFSLTRSRDSAIDLLYAERLRRPAGSRAEYSDLNFMLLGLMIERVAGVPLDQFVTREVLQPTAMNRSTYRPADSLTRWIAPTGRWRGQAICCEVNDQNAVRLGGAAGHAGLFATATDVARYARMWMQGGIIDGQRVLDSLTVRQALTPTAGAGDRLIGWEQPDPKKRDDSAYGSKTSLKTYGHTGWTGTLVWIDPTRDLFVVFLTNRSYDPKVSNSIRALRGIRGALADEIIFQTDRN